MYYLRKITRGKWPGEETITQATLKDIQADTVQAEFKTDNNKLSVWKIDKEEDLTDALIALGSNCENIGTIEAVMIDERCIPELAVEMEDGNTPTIGINENHRNIINLNFVSLGELIKSMIHGLQQDGYVRKTKGQMKTILADACECSKLDYENLAPSIQRDIRKVLEKRESELVR